jgi:protease I
MRKTIYIFIICLVVIGCGQKKTSAITTKLETQSDDAFIKAESLKLVNDTTKIKRFAMIVAPRLFNDEEFKTTYQLITRIGHKIIVASRDTILAMSTSNTLLKPQITINDIDTLSFDGLILIGGTGAAIYWDEKIIHQTLQYFARTDNKIIAAICLAPITLLRAGILNGIKATVFEDNATIGEFKNKGAIYEKTNVVVSKNIITASGPPASKDFAKAIIRLAVGY